MTNTEDYNVNFFKPLSDHAKTNTKLISILAIIWFIGVFGFQALLMVLNEPTPENTYNDFQKIWPQVVENQDSPVESKQILSKTVLSVLGKNIAVKDNHKIMLKETLTWAAYTSLPDSTRGILAVDPNPESIAATASVIGLNDAGFDKIMIDLLPSSLLKAESDQLSAETIIQLPQIMELYLVHNQNALTDFNFLGFPFHYWYTAQFLLILFVVLCLTYAVVIDRTNKKHNFVEEA